MIVCKKVTHIIYGRKPGVRPLLGNLSINWIA